MTSEDQDFWDELGIAWRAKTTGAAPVPAGLATRLRQQATLLAATAVLAGLVAEVSVALAAWSLWIGWSRHSPHFLARGITLAAVASLAGLAALLVQRRHQGDVHSLTDGLKLACARGQRLIRATDLCLYALGILAAGGALGYELRSHTGHASALPLLTDFLGLGIVLAALLWYRRTQAKELRKHRNLSTAFAASEAPGESSP
jgi:hypothetical protein